MGAPRGWREARQEGAIEEPVPGDEGRLLGGTELSAKAPSLQTSKPLFLPILGRPTGRPTRAGGSHPSHLQARPTPGSCLPPALLPRFGKGDAAAPGPCPEPRPQTARAGAGQRSELSSS